MGAYKTLSKKILFSSTIFMNTSRIEQERSSIVWYYHFSLKRLKKQCVNEAVINQKSADLLFKDIRSLDRSLIDTTSPVDIATKEHTKLYDLMKEALKILM